MDMGGLRILRKLTEFLKMAEKKQRPKDYDRLCEHIIEEAVKARFEVKMLKTVVYGDDGFPLLMLKSKSKDARYNGLVLSGAHGDEFWAVDSLIHSLADLDTTLWNLWVVPVLNPFGWKFGIRKNGERKESNFRVGERDTKELSVVFRNLPPRIDLALDVHGDFHKSTLYCYERALPGTKSLARLAMNDVADYFDIDTARKIYGEPCKSGVVLSGAEATCEEYLFEHHGATYAVTIELPGRITGTGTNRIAGGARLIVSTFNNFERAKGEGTKKVEQEKNVEEKVEPRSQPNKEEIKDVGRDG